MSHTHDRPSRFYPVLLVIEAGLAVLALLLPHGFTAVHGNVTDTAFKGLTWGLKAGPAGLAFGLVAVVAESA